MTETSATGFPVTTALELTGMTVEQNLGVVFGLVVRSMGVAKSLGRARRDPLPDDRRHHRPRRRCVSRRRHDAARR